MTHRSAGPACCTANGTVMYTEIGGDLFEQKIASRYGLRHGGSAIFVPRRNIRQRFAQRLQLLSGYLLIRTSLITRILFGSKGIVPNINFIIDAFLDFIHNVAPRPLDEGPQTAKGVSWVGVEILQHFYSRKPQWARHHSAQRLVTAPVPASRFVD